MVEIQSFYFRSDDDINNELKARQISPDGVISITVENATHFRVWYKQEKQEEPAIVPAFMATIQKTAELNGISISRYNLCECGGTHIIQEFWVDYYPEGRTTYIDHICLNCGLNSDDIGRPTRKLSKQELDKYKQYEQLFVV